MRSIPKREKQTEHSRLKKAIRVVGLIVKSIGILVLASTIVGVTYGVVKIKPLVDNAKAAAYDKMTTIDKNTFRKLSDTKIYDKEGTKIGEINISNYKYAELAEISKYIQDGYIAVEDQRFALHNGIDYKGIARAFYKMVQNKGKETQGGSTITQQVLKNNVIGTDINKWDRKMIEFFLAPEFEKMFTKGNIMEFYCNSNFYQNNCYGVETASNFYFGKSAKDVSLAEAALLVGLSNNPSRYNPAKHPEEALEKRHIVLSKMLELGKITQDEFNSADSEPLNLVLEKESRTKESYQVSFAIHCATLKVMENNGFEFKYTFKDKDEYSKYKEEYKEEYKMISDEIRSGGYEIYTSLDSDKQAKLQNILDEELSMFTEVSDDGRYLMQGAITLIDNSTQKVSAIIGGRGLEDEYNRGYQGYRQPGSSIKPVIDYAPAFESGKYYPSKMVVDSYIEDGPKNANGKFRNGPISIREAIARSTNTVAWKVLDDIGIQKGLEYLDKLKFSGLSYIDGYNSAMALGGFTYGATTFEMAKAYSVFVNNGVYMDNTCLNKVIYQDDTIYEGKDKRYSVFNADTCYMILDTLKGVIDLDYGTGKSVRTDGIIIAGKTGTTNDKKDGWFCGVTKDYSMAVWCGYDTPKKIDDMSGGKYPGSIFKRVIECLYEGKESADFNKPITILEEFVDSKGERTDKNTGVTDLFSKIALEKLEQEKRELEEKKRLEKVEKEKEQEDEKEKKVKLSLSDFSTYVILDSVAIEEYDKEYKRLESQIKELKDANLRNLYLNELRQYYNNKNSDNSIKMLRIELEETRQREKEEREALELQRAKEEKERSIYNAKNLILELEKINKGEVKYPSKEVNDIIDQCEQAIGDCKKYPEYKGFNRQYSEISGSIKDNIAVKEKEKELKEEIVVTESPVETPTSNSNEPTSSSNEPLSTVEPVIGSTDKDETKPIVTVETIVPELVVPENNVGLSEGINSTKDTNEDT